MKSHVLEAIRKYAQTCPDKIALLSKGSSLSYRELLDEIEVFAAQLQVHAPRVLGLMADNGIDWVLADLAALFAGIPLVPLPGFFSRTQLRHTLWYAGVDLVLTDQPDALAERVSLAMTDGGVVYRSLHGIGIDGNCAGLASLPKGTQKITFTSGTTGTPKGVCLSTEAMETVALSLFHVTEARLDDRHVCVLPLATLLENIAGVYVPLLAGATCIVPSLAEVGLSGSSGLNVLTQLGALDSLQATSAILVPQMLAAQVAAIRAGAPSPKALRFLAVGGGSVSPALLHSAVELGLPVHEGYGLSECSSVVALNPPDATRPGSVGKPLPHVRIEIDHDGEILVRGVHFLGYLGESPEDVTPVLHTGDLGYMDEEGYLYVSGRKKNMFITSFGRNVSPEWVERELLAQTGLLQAAVFGEAKPFNVAVIVAHPSMSPSDIHSAMTAANLRLPDYAQVAHWIAVSQPFAPENGLLTSNGRPRRPEIAAAYSTELEALYQGNESHGVLRRVA
ncbi:AMP-binding protein [Uliginosibacterium gangwonense]|uniref:AMP-binding protein n=1 Tax=Uliginosibacterium gangwonense TaxID=392736 RepID=UPI0003683192|nr:AMP-binding protein [Uliginosibacterium gangwonense]